MDIVEQLKYGKPTHNERRLAADEIEKLRAENEDLKIEYNDCYRIMHKIQNILVNTTNILKGPPSELCSPSTHDTAEIAQKIKSENEALRAKKLKLKDVILEMHDELYKHQWQPIIAGVKPIGRFTILHPELGLFQAMWRDVDCWNGDGSRVLRKENRLHIMTMNGWTSTQSDKFTHYKPLPTPPKESDDE